MSADHTGQACLARPTRADDVFRALCSCVLLSFMLAARANAGTFLMPAGDGQRSVAYAADGRLGEIVMESWDEQVMPASVSSNGNRILYRERTPGGSPSAWEQVAFTGGTYQGFLRGACLSFDTAGRPMVTHTSRDNNDLAIIQRRVREAGVWKTVASWNGPPEFVNAMSAAFVPRADGTMNVLLMTQSTNYGGCSLHHARLPASSGTVEWETLEYFHGSTMNGFDVPNPVHLLKDLPRNLSLAVDASGALHAVYSNENTYEPVPGGTAQRSNLVYINRSVAGQWSEPMEVVSPGSGFGDGGIGACIGVAPNGTVAIASTWLPRVATGSTQGPAELRYLVRQTNGSWLSSVVANSADGYQLGDGPRGTGLEPTLVFDAQSRPWIAFADHASVHDPSDWSYAGQVRLATRSAAQSGAWTVSTLIKRGSKSPQDFTTWRPAIATFRGQVAVASTSWSFNLASINFTTQYVVSLQGAIAGLPTITSVSPASGPLAGGTTITVTGTNLLGATVKVGDLAATTVVVNAAGTSLTAKTPAGTAGAKSVSVTTAGGTATKTSAFTYVGVPTITSVTPASGPLAGGTAITLVGTNLLGSTVKVGDLTATTVVVNAAGTSLTAKTPAGTAGAKSVSVTTAGGTATKASAFTYVGVPTITSVTPASGPLAGGTTITVVGTNLLGSTVKVGDLAATTVVVNAAGTSLTAKTPAGTVGAKSVSVTTAGGTATKVSAFTYVALPTITSVAPASGPVAGGTTITVVGTNLLGATVKVGDLAATTVVVNAAGTSLTAKTPAGTVGAKSVSVTTAGGTATKVSAFTYVALPTITSVAPASGPVAGGTTITVAGTNLLGATVKVGDLAATTVVVNAAGTSLTAKTPANTVGAKGVSVTTAGGTATKASAFTYVALPTITSVAPASGPVAGGTTITVAGTNLLGATVKVGDLAATTVVVNALGTSLTAKTPAGTAGAKSVSVTTAGGTATKASAFTYVASLVGGPDGLPSGGSTSKHGDSSVESLSSSAVISSSTPHTALAAPFDGKIGAEQVLILLVESGAAEASCTDDSCDWGAWTPRSAPELGDVTVDTDGNGVFDLCQMRCGDLDLSGSIDLGDLACLLTMAGSEPTLGVADLDQDGAIGPSDAAILVARIRANDSETP